MSNSESLIIEKPVGVIIPPPEIKKIIDNAADYVAKNGATFEQMLKKQQNNPKLNFLKDGDPFHPYYEQMISIISKSLREAPGKSVKIPVPSEEDKRKNQEEIKKYLEEKKLEKEMEIKPPLSDQFTIVHPNITPLEMDIIKISAQFVARNGQRFLSGLSERESKNPQFDFLKPNHHLFGYFTALVESYSKCLLPKKEIQLRLKENIKDRFAIIKSGNERYLWDKRQRENQKKKEDNDEIEKAQLASIDWNEFQIVEVIDFNDENVGPTQMFGSTISNNFDPQPQPNNNNNIIQTPQISKPKEVEKPQVKEKREEDVIMNDNLPEPNMKIVKNYVRRPENNKQEQTQKCPLCKENISLSEYSEHIRIELLDPKWKELKQEMLDKNHNLSLAPSDEMLSNLHSFTKNRPDLFGDINDEVGIEKNKKETKGPEIKWDGYAPNMSRTTANIAMLAQQQRKNFEDVKKNQVDINKQTSNVNPNIQINQIPNPGVNNFTTQNVNLVMGNNLTVGPTISQIPIMINKPPVSNIPMNFNQQNVPNLIRPNIMPGMSPQMMRMPTMNPNMMNMGMMPINMSNVPYGFMGKKENDLIPEDIWIQNTPKVMLFVKVPDFGGDESWGLKGQIIQLPLETRMTITQVKESLSKIVGNMPINRMKLRTIEHFELKKEKTLGYYNFSNGFMIEMIIKERGGKKN